MPAEQAEHLVFSLGWDTPGFSHGEDVTEGFDTADLQDAKVLLEELGG